MNELTKDSEQLLNEIKKHIHESEYWANKFSMLNSKGNTILRGCFKELKDKQMISVQWADNIPYNICYFIAALNYLTQILTSI